jgi:acyl-CoA thioester hydrolase
MKELLKDCPVVIEIPVAWGEMDSMQHVNNAVYFRYFESARIAYFDRVNFRELMDKGIGAILASIQCKFKIPLTYPDTVSVGVRVSNMEEDRFIIQHYVVSHRLQKIAAEGEGIVVSYNYKENRKTAIPQELKERIIALEKSVKS